MLLLVGVLSSCAQSNALTFRATETPSSTTPLSPAETNLFEETATGQEKEEEAAEAGEEEEATEENAKQQVGAVTSISIGKVGFQETVYSPVFKRIAGGNFEWENLMMMTQQGKIKAANVQGDPVFVLDPAVLGVSPSQGPAGPYVLWKQSNDVAVMGTNAPLPVLLKVMEGVMVGKYE